MGNSQTFTVLAKAFDDETGTVLNAQSGVSFSYSVISGPASFSSSSSSSLSTFASGTGTVILKVEALGSAYAPESATVSFDVDGSKAGQVINFKKEERGGLRDLPLSRKPIPIGKMALINSTLPITFTLTKNPNKIAKIVGSGENALLVIADKEANPSNKFSGFGGASDLSITIRATQAGNGSYHAALPVERQIKIMKPGKNAFFKERRWDDRFDSKKSAFMSRMASKKGISGEKAIRLFDSDNYDSDGDGVSNLMERAFGGDSLSNDRKSIMPRAIRKKDGHEYVTFVKFEDSYNTGNEKIEYIVETSRDLRTWYPHTDLTNGPIQVGSGVDVGGGMERVVYKSRNIRTAGGHTRQYIRVRVRTR
jgi:hypothetical protein